MSLKYLYQELILDHNKHPKNNYELKNPDFVEEGYNSICGDKVKVFVKIKGNIIENISFKGVGCAISQSSASLMTEKIKGKDIEAAKYIFKCFQNMLLGETLLEDILGKLVAFNGVGKFPTRIKCAILPWHALNKILMEI